MLRFDRVRRSAASAILPLTILSCNEGHAPVAPDTLPEVVEIRLRVQLDLGDPQTFEPSGPVTIETGDRVRIYPDALDADGNQVTLQVRDELTFFTSDSRIVRLQVTSFFFLPILDVSSHSAGEARTTVRHSRAGRGVQASVDFVVSPRSIAQLQRAGDTPRRSLATILSKP